MNLIIIRNALLWCSIINYGLLIVWFLFFVLARDWLYRLHAKWYRVSVEQFDALNYGGIMLFKIGVLLLNVVPLVALWIVG